MAEIVSEKLVLGGVNMTVRERTQETESRILSPFAALSSKSRGRRRPEEEDELRTVFQRDRDRIIHCKSFRRLKHKTQVFLSPEGDHYRTRLTHTLEVSQIARTIARALLLNEDLTEAIALAHDLGHTPFGHAGERALNQLNPKGFRHYEQSVRVVEKLEKNGRGLNLTEEVLDGIYCHTCGQEAFTLEGRIVRLADRIAYINHDIEDAERAGVLDEQEIPREITAVLGASKSQRINTLVESAYQNSQSGAIALEENVQTAFDRLHAFMFSSVYTNPSAKKEEVKVPNLIEVLYRYMKDPDHLPEPFRRIAGQEGCEQAACDYIAGMTDQYAVQLFEMLYVPRSWNGMPMTV